jgi:alkanesulfonate monooxygenase SsuD/methylene tetrahydromethanopterin reductase-like flavin-dependent oxidoreductase (luciferase family)
MKYSLVYSYQVEYDDPHRTFMESVDQIRLAEEHGFDAALITEHHLVENGYFPAPLITASAIAMRTRTTRVGTGVLLLPLYDPLHVAEHASIVDAVSNGRLVLAVGYGYRQEEFDAFHVKLDDRPGRLKEGIECIRAMWTQPTMSYQGKHFQYKDITLRPQPIQKPHPPIWMAAKAEGAVKQAARIADAWFGDPITPFAVTKQRLAAYKSVLAQRGKPTSGFDFPLYREAYCADSDDQAWEEAKDGVLYIYKEYLDWGHMLDDEGNPMPPGDDRFLATLRKRFIIGSPETCAREVLRCQNELGATNVVMRMKFPGLAHQKVMNSIRLFGEKVMPAVARGSA